MSLFNKSLNFKIGNAIFFVLIILTALLTLLFLKINNPKYSSLISGLATGFALATIQFLFSWYEYVKIDKYRQMKIIDIRPDRDKRELYGSLINGSKEEIAILAVTASRLVNDFADVNSSQEHNKVLLTALSRNVKVKILLPNKSFLEVHSQAQFEILKTKFDKLNRQYPNFEFKYFNHLPNHSIFLVDHYCIIGPVFQGVSSKNTPSMHVEASSPFAKTYLDYFNSEWQNN